MGELAPYEMERKFLVEYPDVAWLESLPNCQRVEIVQSYLRSEPDQEIRIRQRGTGESCMYYLTEKRIDSHHKRMELQRRLTEREYLRLMGVCEGDIDNLLSVGLSRSNLYQLAGNSIVCDVMASIFTNLFSKLL